MVVTDLAPASTSILPLSQAQSSKEGVSTCLKELVNEAKTQAASQQLPLCVETGQTVRVSRAIVFALSNV